MAHWHTLDLTNFDLVPAARTAHKVSGEIGKRALETARDATYVTVGFGLLAFQRAQVTRREFEKSLRN